MAPKRINVLVYAGIGSSKQSVQHCLHSLRQLLFPNYAVSTCSAEVLLKEPWVTSCALVVFPGGGDVGYCRALNGHGNTIIRDYVRQGGSYLGFCAGGYYGSKKCEFEIGDDSLEVVGERELGFFPGICRGSAFKGFQYNDETGTRAAVLSVHKASFPPSRIQIPQSFRSYFNGGSVFMDAENFKDKGIEVLASYTEPLAVDPGKGAAAVIYSKVNAGGAILTGPHPEFAASNLSKHAKGLSPAVIDALAEDDDARTEFMRACLLKLGLEINERHEKAQPLSTIHLSSPFPNELLELLQSYDQVVILESGQKYIEAEQDNFHLVDFSTVRVEGINGKLEDRLASLNVGKRDESDTTTDSKDRETLVLATHTAGLPSRSDTPSFNHDIFFSQLRRLQTATSTTATQTPVYTFGRFLLYGEVVTSTSTILEKNLKLTARLPQGTTFTATTQVAGRGRGSNVWVSPAGTLLFSTIIRHPLLLNTTAPVIFIQYIAALAVVEGIKNYADFSDADEIQKVRSYQSLPVRLKWPNDIYARDPVANDADDSPTAFTKIGGILVNSSYCDGDYTLVVGIGLNVSNTAGPTTSLNALLRHLEISTEKFSPPMMLEPLLASILASFEHLYRQFCNSGWNTYLEDLYYSYWLHSGQIVTVDTEAGLRARVKGVTRDWGLLLVEEVEDGGSSLTPRDRQKVEGREGKELQGTGRMFALQTDSNSFDFFKGLLKRKL